jgi:3-hydroxy-9,10-secoandrosta-1,3,5(10)-triene-9,17-dione monooxygenase reductase component
MTYTGTLTHTTTVTTTPTTTTAQLSTLSTPRLSSADFKQLMASWGTGVAVVTSMAGGEPMGCTVNAITSVSLDPPLLLVSLAARSRTLAAIRDQRRLAMNILPAQQVALVRQFSHGEPADRFAGVAYRCAEGVPVLSDVVVAAVCVTERFVPVADHVLVIAAPVWWHSTSNRRPLVCYGRSYWSLWSMGVVGRR